MDRKTKTYNNNCGRPDIERATIVKYKLTVTGCDGETAFREYVSETEKKSDYFLHFIIDVDELKQKALRCTMISWVNQDLSDWLIDPMHRVSEYAADSIKNKGSLKLELLGDEEWLVFDFEGSELINCRNCSDIEAEEFFETLYKKGNIIRVFD